ncbi:cobyrinate a,c-diamide synthase [Streptococcus catagoni]|uniref:cobyrinate a,c-diamide synthase n=1 Tax=Streptococcus catagoni TaxID=2654874 RepID=UPI00140A5B92|nr:cobyrinate a,c-diamide synthase [Streptococcus catagoni]
MKQFMIAGVSSGVGKTTITLGLLKALANRGYKVQPYKVGPDYIDSSYHSRITGRASRNLDSFMIPNRDYLNWAYYHCQEDADVALVEGVMGLFDGLGTDKDCASSADIAKKLDLPVILLVNGKSSSTSVAAIVHGFDTFDPHLQIAGVIINGLASQGHYQLIKKAIERYSQVPVLGYFPKNTEFKLPSRHLGLVPDVELEDFEKTMTLLGDMAQEHIDLDQLLEVVERPKRPVKNPFTLWKGESLRIAYALDQAFHFYYEDNLELLRSLGVSLLPFSPLKDQQLPEADAYYFGGGFPEVFAKQLSDNHSFRKSVLKAHKEGIPIFAECGGLMYLGKDLQIEEDCYDMVGIFEGESIMTSRLKRFGYCQAKTKTDGLFGPKGTEIRGHEFHHSVFQTKEEPVLSMKKVRDQELVATWECGYQKGHSFASYLHIHFYQDEALLAHFLDYIRRAKK